MNQLNCANENRREQVRVKPQLFGLDYLEVEPNKRTNLTLHFLGKAPDKLELFNFVIAGGRRRRDLRITDFKLNRFKHAELDDTVELIVSEEGDHSNYVISVVERNAAGHWQPHSAFDPRYRQLEFNFKLDCPSELDCRAEHVCPPEKRTEPVINYLAKDYASFRQLLFDRLALLMPEWRERHVPDLGVALVELLAYTGDYLSYYQDAVATEAYLDTARQRISVQRHVRLIDYRLHEGCNARAWVCIETSGDLTLDGRDCYLITNANDTSSQFNTVLAQEQFQQVMNVGQPPQYEAFEPVVRADLKLFAAHNELRFYTWGDSECCLSKGVTAATLVGKLALNPVPKKDEDLCDPPKGDSAKNYNDAPVVQAPANKVSPAPLLHLQVGDVLIFEEVRGAATGNPADADPAHRHAVRLTGVTANADPVNGQAVVEIEWAAADALPFALCLSLVGPAPACQLITDVSVARGNVVLVDHGRSFVEDLGVVPLKETIDRCERAGTLAEVELLAGRFNPALKRMPLTFSQSYNSQLPAAQAFKQVPHLALPHITLRSIPGASAIPGAADGLAPLFEWDDFKHPAALISRLQGASTAAAKMLRQKLSRALLISLGIIPAPSSDLSSGSLASPAKPLDPAELLLNELAPLLETWEPQPDLLASRADDRHFVVELDNDSRAYLRFGGNDELGAQPAAGQAFQATYRIGNGPAGNVGAEAITTLITVKKNISGGITRVRNPLAAVGGTAPEPLAEAKLFAPRALRQKLERAITADDYATITAREFSESLQGAAATLRWTGSWYEAQVVLDSRGTDAADPALLEAVFGRLHRYRRIGHDLTVKAAQRVPLTIEIEVCVLPAFQAGHVKAALLNAFSTRTLPDGRRGFFHPDNLTFGQGIALSRLLAAAQTVAGVESARVTKLERKFAYAGEALVTGLLKLSPLEIAQVANDPSLPELGTIKFNCHGGR